MLTALDRLQIASLDRRATAQAWQRLLDASPAREDRVKCLGAERSVLRVGASEVEILEPTGIGPMAQHVSRFGSGLYGVGFATPDPAALGERLDAYGVHHVVENGQILLHHDWLDVPGLHVVISPCEAREPVGLVTRLYEATHLCHDYRAASARIAEVFALDPAHFVPIRSEQYGYEGTLTLFDPERLDRVETVTPFDRSRTMGRYFARRGPCLYMAYAESDDSARVRERLLEHAPQDWTGPAAGGAPDNLYVHPRALDGVMLGVSRTSFAWTWSGRPERVRRAAASGAAGAAS